MPKMKTNSSVKKRFKRTATGKIVCAAAHRVHKLAHKSKSMKRASKGTMVVNDANFHSIDCRMPYNK